MKRRLPARRALARLCGELHDDDGTNPRDDRRSVRRAATDGQKHRLTRAAARALTSGLAELSDPLLSAVEIVEVQLTDRGTLDVAVTIRAGPAPAMPDPRGLILERLAQVRGFLRSGLARELNRRRTPELRFRWADLRPEMEEQP